ncbi:MAG TPA: hypothetical protein VLB51_06395 [Methylomirabilota bacterium]|nr:hypothetical protein [Methylomirabilota bacterium]
MRGLRFTGSMAAVLVLAAAAVRAAEPPVQATGRWQGDGVEFAIAGAYAYPARVGSDDRPGVRVAISNAEFVTEGMNRLWDRQGWIVRSFSDDQTAVVFLHFDDAGGYVGMSYSFGPGTGCGFCFSSDTKSSVKRVGDRIAGSLSHKDDELVFEVSFDVPVAPTVWGEPLPADGGEPGKAYLAYLRALDDWDPEALRPHLMPEDQERADQAAAEDLNVAQIYAESFYPQKARFVGGSHDGDWARVLVVGESSWGGAAHGEAIMHRVDGSWRMWLDQAEVGEWPEHLAPPAAGAGAAAAPDQGPVE